MGTPLIKPVVQITPSESKVIFIDTTSIGIVDPNDLFKPSNAPKSNKKKVISALEQSKYYKYWTVSIASTQNSASPKNVSSSPVMMGFGICDATHSDESKEEEVTDDMLSSSQCDDDGYCVSYGSDQMYQSYHTKLKSLDDILIAFNTKTHKVTLWQNGKRFNKVFQLHPERLYGFGIKLMCDEYCINIIPDTGT